MTIPRCQAKITLHMRPARMTTQYIDVRDPYTLQCEKELAHRGRHSAWDIGGLLFGCWRRWK